MKKKIVCMLLVTMMAFTMVACSNDSDTGKDNDTQSSQSSSDNSDKDTSDNEDNSDDDGEVSVDEPDVNISADDLAKKLLEKVKFKDELSKIEKEMALMQYNLTDEDVEEVVMYLSTGASAEEIAVFKVKDGAQRKVQSAVEKRVSDKKVSFKDYNPDELPKLEDPTMYSKGDYVVLCISENDDKSRKIIDEYMSEK